MKNICWSVSQIISKKKLLFWSGYPSTSVPTGLEANGTWRSADKLAVRWYVGMCMCFFTPLLRFRVTEVNGSGVVWRVLFTLSAAHMACMQGVVWQQKCNSITAKCAAGVHVALCREEACVCVCMMHDVRCQCALSMCAHAVAMYIQRVFWASMRFCLIDKSPCTVSVVYVQRWAAAATTPPLKSGDKSSLFAYALRLRISGWHGCHVSIWYAIFRWNHNISYIIKSYYIINQP